MKPIIKSKIYIKQTDLECIKGEVFRAMLIGIILGIPLGILLTK